ncbi:hypothetical protein AB0D49_36235 [Streptomyces sp. NPDC048290]|uniref:hypothetical protein n=1 Tax=Streptomyces sp. NPDC048290 TaxID=3155811 RepID=UPI00341712D1
MSTPTPTIPREVLDLLPLPPLNTLTDAQERGSVCVWDPTEDPLTAETAIDLGERWADGSHWFPRACRTHTETALRAGAEATA